MNPIYVSGHKNPDSDSICSAIAYADFKKQMGEQGYTPVRLGELNEETKFVLNTFHAPVPRLITSVKAQVSDLNYDVPVLVKKEMPVRTVWENMNSKGVNTMPVVDEQHRLLGLISLRDIANSDINAVYGGDVVDTTMKNLLTTLSAKQLCGPQGEIRGEVVIAKDKNDLDHAGAIVICPWEQGIERQAAQSGAVCVVLTSATQAGRLDEPIATATVATDYDTYKTARLIYQSTPVGRVMKASEVVSIHMDDYLDDVKEIFIDTRYRSYPVLNQDNVVVGMISRDHLLSGDNQKKVVLVDHNEISQSIPGLHQATILEIIDHHKLGDIQTAHPLYFRSEPVGCTATIIANMYQENGITPGPDIAGIMLCAILSDTVLFKSPTCTPRDKETAKYLADIAGVEIDSLGNDLFTAGSSLVKEGPAALLNMDFKEFNIGGKRVGIGQVTIWDVELVRPMQDEIKDLMQAKVAGEGYDLVLFMETSIKAEGTNLVCAGDYQKVVQGAFGQPVQDGEVYLPGVMSRKKQIVPQITANL